VSQEENPLTFSANEGVKEEESRAFLNRDGRREDVVALPRREVAREGRIYNQ